MKNAFFSILLLCIANLISAQVTFESTLEEAFEKAKNQNKLVFIEYYRPDCPVCLQLEDLFKNDSELAAFYNSNFVNYAVNTQNQTNKTDLDFIHSFKLNLNKVPALLYFDANKNFLHFGKVNLNSIALINESKKALLPSERSTNLVNKYENGDRTVKTLYAYCNQLILTNEYEKLIKVSQELYESFNKEELPTKKSYIVLKQVIKNTDNGFFQFWIHNLDKLNGFENKHKAGTEKLVLEQIVINELNKSNYKNFDAAKKEIYKNYLQKLNLINEIDRYFK